MKVPSSQFEQLKKYFVASETWDRLWTLCRQWNSLHLWFALVSFLWDVNVSLSCQCQRLKFVAAIHLSWLLVSAQYPHSLKHIFRSDSLECPACHVFLSLLLGEHYQEHWDLLLFERMSKKVCTQCFFTVQVHPGGSDTVFPTDLWGNKSEIICLCLLDMSCV